MEAKVRAWKLKICYLSIFEQKSGIKKEIITYFTRHYFTVFQMFITTLYIC